MINSGTLDLNQGKEMNELLHLSDELRNVINRGTQTKTERVEEETELNTPSETVIAVGMARVIKEYARNPELGEKAFELDGKGNPKNMSAWSDFYHANDALLNLERGRAKMDLANIMPELQLNLEEFLGRGNVMNFPESGKIVTPFGDLEKTDHGIQFRFIRRPIDIGSKPKERLINQPPIPITTVHGIELNHDPLTIIPKNKKDLDDTERISLKEQKRAQRSLLYGYRSNRALYISTTVLVVAGMAFGAFKGEKLLSKINAFFGGNEPRSGEVSDIPAGIQPSTQEPSGENPPIKKLEGNQWRKENSADTEEMISILNSSDALNPELKGEICTVIPDDVRNPSEKIIQYAILYKDENGKIFLEISQDNYQERLDSGAIMFCQGYDPLTEYAEFFGTNIRKIVERLEELGVEYEIVLPDGRGESRGLLLSTYPRFMSDEFKAEYNPDTWLLVDRFNKVYTWEEALALDGTGPEWDIINIQVKIFNTAEDKRVALEALIPIQPPFVYESDDYSPQGIFNEYIRHFNDTGVLTVEQIPIGDKIRDFMKIVDNCNRGWCFALTTVGEVYVIHSQNELDQVKMSGVSYVLLQSDNYIGDNAFLGSIFMQGYGGVNRKLFDRGIKLMPFDVPNTDGSGKDHFFEMVIERRDQVIEEWLPEGYYYIMSDYSGSVEYFFDINDVPEEYFSKIMILKICPRGSLPPH